MNKNAKICFIATISKSLEWFVADTAKYLFEQGFKNITFIANMDDDFINKNSCYAHCIHLDYKRGANLKSFFRSIKETKRVFKKEQFDLIYYLTPNASFYASYAGKKCRIPHRVYSQCGIMYVSKKGLKRAIFKIIEKKTCSFSTEIRSQSPLNMEYALKEKLTKPSKIKVLGIGGTTGVDLKYCDSFNHEEMNTQLRDTLGIPLNSFVFGYVGRLNPDKGSNELIEAFNRLIQRHSNVYLIHVGMVDESNMIKKQNYDEYISNNNIIKIGNVPPNSVYEYMSMMDALVHPTYREGFGKVLQEAMGMSLPIITTNVIGPKEVVEKDISGILVEAKNSFDLEKAMEQVLLDQELRTKLSKNGRVRAETYFERKKMIQNIYEDLKAIMGDNDD